MPVSPLEDSDGDVFVSVLSAGTALPDSVNIVSVEIHRALGRIPSARIVIADDSEEDPAQRMVLADSDQLAPGKAVQIKAGYGSAATVVFDGVVVKLGMRCSGIGSNRLVAECRDKAVAMTVGRKNATYVDQSDSDLIAKLVSSYGGLSSEVDSTAPTHKELVQYDVSDWDYLLARAELNGLMVDVDAGKISAKAPATGAAEVLSLTYGVDLEEIDAEIDARTQLTQVSGTAWDPATQAIVEQQAAVHDAGLQGNLAAKPLAEVVGLPGYRLQSSTPLDTDTLKAWTGARQLRAALARVRGRLRFRGSALAKPGALVQLNKVGKRFEGKAYLSAVTHLIEDGDWSTEAEFGLQAETLAERQPLSAPLAAGLTSGVAGLQIGVVLQLDQDPQAQYKIKVSLPVLQAETDGVWARLASHYGSSGNGSFFIPEIGDEVVLGFLDSDPSHPLILASLYSSSRKPPYELTAENNTKAIVTRSKLRIEFDEDKKVVTILTPGNNKVVISDDAKSITLQDQNDNKLTLSPDGIALDSPKDITLTAKGKITLDAVGEIGVASKADIKQTGLNISCTANVGFTAKGSASAELSASGQTTVKGAMVMIN